MANMRQGIVGIATILLVATSVLAEEDDPALSRVIGRLFIQLRRQHLHSDSAGHDQQPEHLSSRTRRLALVNRRFLWPGGTVPFAIYNDTSYGQFTTVHKETIRRALRYIASVSCVRFREIPQQEVIDYPRGKLMIAGGTRGSACQSEIGMGIFRPFQVIYLTLGCLSQYAGNSIAHEMMHALGFFHEHTRPDRDQYIKINLRNILPRSYRSFTIQRTPTDTLNTEYDFESLQHYSDYQYLRPNLPYRSRTFTPLKNISVKIGQRYALSAMDVFRINRLYRCTDTHAPSRELSCYDCITFLHIIANLSIGNVDGKDANNLRLLMVSNNRGTFRTEDHTLKIRNKDTGESIHIWRAHPVQGCLTPGDIQLIALRATSKVARVQLRSVAVVARIGSTSRYLAVLNDTNVTMTLSRTEYDAQQVLRPVPQPTCAACKSSCIDYLSITLKFTERVTLRARLEIAVNYVSGKSRRWTLKTMRTLMGRGDSMRSHVYQGNMEGCMPASSIKSVAIVQGTMMNSIPLPVGLHTAFVTASLVDGSRVVLVDSHRTASHREAKTLLVFEGTQSCAPGCQGCSDD